MAGTTREKQTTVGPPALQNQATVCQALFCVLWGTVVTTVSAIYGAYKFNCLLTVIIFSAANSWPTVNPPRQVGLLLLKCVLDNNIIPTTRGPTKPAVLATVGSFTKVEARRTPLAPATVYRAPHTGRWPPTPARRGRRDFTRVHLGTLGTIPVGSTNE